MSLQEVFNHFTELKVLVIGDLMIDSYLWGSVSRISPEAPVPIVDVKTREKRLGGAANVGLNISSLGAKPVLCGLIGEDQDGEELLSLLKEKNLTTSAVVKSEERPTTIKHRIISNSQQMLRVDAEDSKIASQTETEKLLQVIKGVIGEVNVVVFEDYDKGVITSELISFVIAECKSLGIPVVVDPKKRNFLNYSGATLFKPNLKELKEGLNIDFDYRQIKEVSKAATALKKELLVDQALVTLSEKGMFLSGERHEYHKAAHVRSISDVSGAGDTVISVASICLALGLNPEFLVDLSNLAGGLVCEYVGVVPIDKQQLYDEALKYGLEKLL